jgi:hypothetical protein
MVAVRASLGGLPEARNRKIKGTQDWIMPCGIAAPKAQSTWASIGSVLAKIPAARQIVALGLLAPD